MLCESQRISQCCLASFERSGNWLVFSVVECGKHSSGVLILALLELCRFEARRTFLKLSAMGNASCCTSKDTDKYEATEAQRKDTPGLSGSELIANVSPSPPLAASSKSSPTEGKGSEFKITIDKTNGTRMGVDVDHQDGATLLVDAITGGLMGAWNAADPNKAVKQGDRIVEVNGIRGDVLQLVDECKKNKVLEMVVRKG